MTSQICWFRAVVMVRCEYGIMRRELCCTPKLPHRVKPHLLSRYQLPTPKREIFWPYWLKGYSLTHTLTLTLTLPLALPLLLTLTRTLTHTRTHSFNREHRVLLYKLLLDHQLALLQTIEVKGTALDAQFDEEGSLLVSLDTGLHHYTPQPSGSYSYSSPVWIWLTILCLLSLVVLGEYKEVESEWVQKLVAGVAEKVTLDESASTKVVGFGRYSKKSAPPERKRQKTKQEKPKEKNK